MIRDEDTHHLATRIYEQRQQRLQQRAWLAKLIDLPYEVRERIFGAFVIFGIVAISSLLRIPATHHLTILVIEYALGFAILIPVLLAAFASLAAIPVMVLYMLYQLGRFAWVLLRRAAIGEWPEDIAAHRAQRAAQKAERKAAQKAARQAADCRLPWDR
jgi:hypothetical protein